jgi:hypothetical protein
MTGEQLYKLWAKSLKHFDCEADTWNDLEEIFRQAWEYLATQVSPTQ